MTIPATTALTQLQRSLSEHLVLSVYFTARSDNPSQRNNWRAKLKSELRKLDKSMTAVSATERHAFDAARMAFDALDIPALSQADGVACFVTADGVQRVERLPFRVDTIVAWGKGVALAPFVRALKAGHPVVVAVADGQSARLYLFRGNRLDALGDLQVEPHLRQPTHMSTRVSPKFHPGTHGVAGQDESQREWAAATERLSRRLADQIAHHAGDTAWVILGGRADVLHQVQAALPKAVRERTGESPDITVQSPHHELENAAREGASALRNAADARALQHLADGGDERHGAALGENAARRALDSAAVARLYLSPRFVADHADRAETAVRAALEQGAEIETVAGAAGATLDSMGGIAARLRYSIP
jgi:hypothetical protein